MSDGLDNVNSVLGFGVAITFNRPGWARRIVAGRFERIRRLLVVFGRRELLKRTFQIDVYAQPASMGNSPLGEK
jgi:hypothetical protein